MIGRLSAFSPKISRDALPVLLSILIQVPLAVYLGHFYDDRIAMATGYLVDAGLNPYMPHYFSNIFPNQILSETIPAIGYPPLWPLWLGAAYRLTYAATQNLLLYNFAIKIPIIISNIALAFLVRHIVASRKEAAGKAQGAFLLILFNPFILLTSAAWGAIDVIVAALSLAAFWLLSKTKTAQSSLLLAVAIALKPIALPLAPLPIFFAADGFTKKKKLFYAALFSVALASCTVGLFGLAGWRMPLGVGEWDTQMLKAGGLTPYIAVEFFFGQSVLPVGWGFLGFLWVPALLVAYVLVYFDRPRSLGDLALKAVAVLLVFFVCRSWLSEPNVNVLLPFLLVAACFGLISLRWFHAAWLLPLLFMFPNYAFPQLFFLANPNIMANLLMANESFGGARLAAQILIVLVWMAFAFSTVAKTFWSKKELMAIK